MSGHALMGRPAARLETMALVISLYVLVFIVGKNLFDKTPVFLRHIAYYELNVKQRMTPRTNVSQSRNPTNVSYLVQ